MTHYFVIDFCERYGVNANAAILLSNICYWCALNKKNQNKKNYINGRYWMYNSLEAFAAQYPYMSINQIRYALNILKKTGAVDCANHNPNEFDRTLWYSPSEEAMRIYLYSYNRDKGENCQDKNDNDESEKEIPYDKEKEHREEADDVVKFPNRFGNFTKCICENSQIIIPDNKPINKPNSSSSELRTIFQKIHPRLIFDDEFYLKADSFLRCNDLDPSRYALWIRDFALKKGARDMRAYFYTLFFRDEVLAQYLNDLKDSEKNIFVCPVCGQKNPGGFCSDCGLSPRSDEEEIETARQKFQLPPQEFEAWLQNKKQERKNALEKIKTEFHLKFKNSGGLKNEINFV